MSATSISLAELISLRLAAKLISLGGNTRVTTAAAGGYSSTLRGRGIEFEEVRSYHPGDDIRHMDWRVTARTGEPHTKLYQEERERPVILLIDLNPSMFFATQVAYKSKIAAQTAAVIAWAALAQGDRVGALIFQDDKHIEFKPAAREKAVLPILQTISNIEKPTALSNQENSFSEALASVRRIIKPGSMLVVISDFMNFDEQAKRHLIQLSKHHQLLSVQINDPIEIEPPPAGFYAVSDGVERLQFNSDNNEFRRAYEQQFSNHYKKVAETMKKYKLPLINCLTTENIAEVLRKGLRYGQRR